MNRIKDEVYLGKFEEYNKLLQMIADFAQTELWSYGRYKETDKYIMLRNYFEHTYNRIAEENKFVLSFDGRFRCMNTGLLTDYNQEIYAVFKKSDIVDGLPWSFTRVHKDTDRFISEKFSEKPQMANYLTNASDLIYDKNIEIKLNIDHIVDDNFERFVHAGYLDKSLIHALLLYSMDVLKKKLLRNYRIALPFYYRNTQTGESKIQLLVPVYFPNALVRLALVLDKRKNDDGNSYYEAITVLPVEWAYMDSRLIVKPDDEWARLIDSLDSDVETDDECESYENIQKN